MNERRSPPRRPRSRARCRQKLYGRGWRWGRKVGGAGRVERGGVGRAAAPVLAGLAGAWAAGAGGGGAAGGACAKTGQVRTIICAARASKDGRISFHPLRSLKQSSKTAPVALTRVRSD